MEGSASYFPSSSSLQRPLVPELPPGLVAAPPGPDAGPPGPSRTRYPAAGPARPSPVLHPAQLLTCPHPRASQLPELLIPGNFSACGAQEQPQLAQRDSQPLMSRGGTGEDLTVTQNLHRSRLLGLHLKGPSAGGGGGLHPPKTAAEGPGWKRGRTPQDFSVQQKQRKPAAQATPFCYLFLPFPPVAESLIVQLSLDFHSMLQ